MFKLIFSSIDPFVKTSQLFGIRVRYFSYLLWWMISTVVKCLQTRSRNVDQIHLIYQLVNLMHIIITLLDI